MTSADHVVPAAAAAAHRLKAGRGLHLASIIWKIRRLEVKGSLMHLALRLAARGDQRGSLRVGIEQDLLFSAEEYQPTQPPCKEAPLATLFIDAGSS
jgi:hypothetical protein